MDRTVSSKKDLRSKLRARRQSFGDDAISAKSAAAQKCLIESPEFSNAKVVAIYKASFGEVETDVIFKAGCENGKSMLYPKTFVKEKKLRFAKITNFDRLVSGVWGIQEPPENSEWFPIENADLLILPGVAFDRRGGRLGMGGGFYDRMLSTLTKKIIRMGLAYDFQLVDEVPLDANDQRVNCLVTESGVMRFPERG